MRQLDFTTIASLLARNDDAILTPRDLGENGKILIEYGFLLETKLAKYIECFCGEGHFSEVERDNTCGEVSYSMRCADCGGFYFVDPDKLKQWKISLKNIIKELQKDFYCSNEPVERVRDLWYLGESNKAIAKCRRQIFFAKRMTKDIENALPDGTTQLLIIGEENPISISKFKDRIFQMHELLSIKSGKVKFDMALVEERLNGQIKEPKAVTVPKKGKQALREANIKELLKAHLRSAKAAYWNSVDRGNKTILFPRPTAQNLADLLKAKYGESVNQSTVNRTINNSLDKELNLLWKACLEENFVANFERKR